MAEREAAGESLWTTELGEATRIKLIHALREVLAMEHGYSSWRGDPVAAARFRIMRRDGLANLAGKRDEESDLLAAIQVGTVDLVLSLLEALFIEIGAQSGGGYASQDIARQRVTKFENEVNDIFRSDRFSAEMIRGEIVEFRSREMHVEVVIPTLRLLAAGGEWSRVETAYQNALREIDDDPGDAITDAGTALQEALLLCGAEGNALGPLAKSAVKKGLLAPHDSAFADGVLKMIDWVSADRSETGDAHKLGTESRDDAWFAIHVVGALILRLSQQRNRGR